MARRITHMAIGASITLTLYIIYNKLIKKKELTLGGIAGSLGIGIIGGTFPDSVEPATNPNHRHFFHSIAFSLAIILGRKKLYEILGLNEEIKRYFDWFLSAYGSHLICDAQTPKGLPFV
jgi:membrane-bound metal-dependent hydrolase YbcI (DUF457 family)